MNGLVETARLQQRRFTMLAIGFLIVAVGLVILGQPIAAALIPLIGLLLVQILWRDLRARTLARSIIAGQTAEKLEVPPGAWGELSRAVNGMLQQRRVQQRLQAATPAPLPDDALQALRDDDLSGTTKLQVVSVLVVRYTNPHRIERDRRAALTAWQALARVAQTQAQQHGALLQPCGDALLLVFGAFTARPMEATARAALSVATALNAARHAQHAFAGGSLVLALAAGSVMTALVPDLGCCVLGAPVEQAMQLARLAWKAPQFQLLCSESAYYALRHTQVDGWATTEFHVPTATERAQAVYGWSG